MHARLSLALSLLLFAATARAGLVFTSNSVGTYGACAAKPLMNSSSERIFVPTGVCVAGPPGLLQAFTQIQSPFTSVQYVIFSCGGGGLIQMRMYTDSACITEWAPSSGTVSVKPITADSSCNAFSITVTGFNPNTQSQTQVNEKIAMLSAYGNCASSMASPAYGVIRSTSTVDWTCANASMVERNFLKASNLRWYPERPSCSGPDASGLSAFADFSFTCQLVTLPGTAKRKDWSFVYSGCGNSGMGTDNMVPAVPAARDSCVTSFSSGAPTRFFFPACDMGQTAGAASLTAVARAFVAAIALIAAAAIHTIV